MWPFPKPRQALDPAHLELVSQIHGLAQRVKLLEERLLAAEAAHERLRGRFYQLRGPGESQQLTKEQLLAKFVPRRS